MAKAKAKAAPKKVEKPVIPLKEQPGYCRECSGHTFTLRFAERSMIRKCNRCNDEIRL